MWIYKRVKKLLHLCHKSLCGHRFVGLDSNFVHSISILNSHYAIMCNKHFLFLANTITLRDYFSIYETFTSYLNVNAFGTKKCSCWVWSKSSFILSDLFYPQSPKKSLQWRKQINFSVRQSSCSLSWYMLSTYLLLTDLHVDYFVCSSKSTIIQSLPFHHQVVPVRCIIFNFSCTDR